MKNSFNLLLEPFTPEDIPQLIKWVPDEDLLIMFAGSSFTFPLTKSQLQRHLEKEKYVYKVVDRESGKAIGHAELGAFNQANGTATISRVLIGDANMRGMGAGTAIINLLLEECFRTFKLHRVDLRVYDFNHSAIKCYEKCGFKKEGLMRENTRVKGGFWSSWIMSILAHEWQQIHR